MLFGSTAAVDHGRPPSRQLPAWVGYPVAVALEVVVTAILLLIQPYLPLGGYPVYYFLTTMVVAYYFGAGPAILAIVLGLFVYDYFFVPPLRTVFPSAETPVAWAGVVAYIVGTITVAVATVLIRRSKHRAERTADRLRDSEERVRVAVEAADLGTWDLDLVNDVAVRSPRHDEIWGYSEPQPEWGLEIAMQNVLPEDRPLIREAYERGIETGVLSHENRIVWPDGSIHWIAANGRFQYDSEGRPVRVVGVVADITERKKAEEAVLSQAELLLAIIDNIPVYIVIWDGQLKQFQFNEAFRRDMGWTEADAAEGDFMEKVYPDPEYRRQVEEYMQSLQPGFRDLKTTTRDGREVDVAWANVQLTGDRSIGIGINISDRKKAEEERAARAREVQDANEQLAASNEELAVTNEELEVTTEELRQEVEERNKTEAALREEQAHKLDFYRRTIEAATDGKLIVTERPEIEKLTGPPIASWEVLDSGDLKTVRHGFEATARSVGIDQSRLGQVVVAVGEAVTNAVKHARTGEASLHRTDGSLMLTVSDRGPGIPALALPDVALRPRFSTAGTLGMGYKMMIRFADRVYLATDDEGTVVALEFHISDQVRS